MRGILHAKALPGKSPHSLALQKPARVSPLCADEAPVLIEAKPLSAGGGVPGAIDREPAADPQSSKWS
jgi:hypothetical protein